jgi:hypothetical protein
MPYRSSNTLHSSLIVLKKNQPVVYRLDEPFVHPLCPREQGIGHEVRRLDIAPFPYTHDLIGRLDWIINML